MASLQLSRVEKKFDSSQVIKPLDLGVEHGEFVVFVGPSGCGKTTLLRMIAGLENVSGGDIAISGRVVTELPPVERSVAMVFQSYALYPHMTVEENIGFGLMIAGMPKAARREKVHAAARILQLESYLGRKPKTLSGGQRQRVAIGRAIVKEPEIFLFDEPLSNLDAELRVQMRLEIAKLHQKLGATMIYVTHDQVEAMTLADKIVVLREGCIEQTGRPIDLYQNPDNLFVAGFIGSPRMNFVDGTIVSANDRSAIVSVPALGGDVEVSTLRSTPAAGMAVTLGFRAEHVTVGDGPFKATADVVEQLGNLSYAYCTLAGEARLVVEDRGVIGAAAGEEIRFGLKPNSVLAFQPSGPRL